MKLKQHKGLISIQGYFKALDMADFIIKKTTSFDIDYNSIEWQIVEEARLELKILEVFAQLQEGVLNKFDNTINSFYNPDTVQKQVGFLNDLGLEPRLTYQQVGIYRFKQYTFPIELKKSGEFEGVDVISSINPDPFSEPVNNSSSRAYAAGGQNALSIFGITLDFQLLDKDAERKLKNAILNLSKQVSKELSTKIKYQLLEGIRNAESVPELRQRILSVFKTPIDVVVPPKYNEAGDLVRSGYTYQLEPKVWANSVARTEVSKAYAQGKIEGYKQSGVVTKVQFSPAADERTCPECSILDGAQYTLEDGVDIIPVHVCCRCSWIPILKTDDLEGAKTEAQGNIKVLYDSVA
jgi:SPP1 gp7 family putative phage head morphogenesis protein